MILKKLKDFVYIGNIYNVIINGKNYENKTRQKLLHMAIGKELAGQK